VDRDDWRTFRLDRVDDVRRVQGTYQRRELPADSVTAYLGSDFARAPVAVRVVLQADPADLLRDAAKGEQG